VTDPLLAVEGLRVTYPGRGAPVGAVDGISFSVERGEVLGLVGASGCGKSTVVAALAGLLPPTAATSVDRLSLDGLDLRTLDERGWQGIRRRRIGLVPQQPMTALTPTVGVGRQLDWYLGPRAVERHEQALRDLGLDTVVDRPADLPSRFSGGQLQRLLIAVNTLDGHPDLFLADDWAPAQKLFDGATTQAV
jgi:ABC-type glutathione transport system ATPase component